MKMILRGLGIAALFVVAFVVFGYVTMYLWNWLMPYLFHLPVIDFKMAMGLVLLSKILFGGMHMRGNGGWGQRKYWKAKWQSMTPEEREKFKEDFAVRCKHKWGKAEYKPEAEPGQA
ncbi:MAG: hypothetical protein KA149_05160 [Chitinophagales bacterium]|nr:hypothetical protein [Chitinophagales bacterium]